MFLPLPRARFIHRLMLGALALALATGFSLGSRAQADERLTIGEQFGLPYLLFFVMRDQGLIEKHAADRGVEGLEVDWRQISGGAQMNSALLSGSIDIGAAGVGPLLTLWDRTYGNADVRAIAALGSAPIELVTNQERIKSLADFTAQDRIAVPATSVSVQSRILQMAAAKQFGEDQWQRLEPLTVSMSHPEAAAAIISGGTEITGHMANPPFNYQELERPNTHVVLSSYDVLGDNASANLAFATKRFRESRPEVYAAFLDALDEASRYIAAHPAESAETFKRVTGSNLDIGFVTSLLEKPEFNFAITPRHTYPLAEFMYRIGAIKQNPQSWQDYFFPEVHADGGS